MARSILGWTRLAAAAALLLAFAGACLAQSVVSPDTAQVFTTGTVNATLVQPDGKVLIGGTFATVNGVTRNNLARLNTDGTVDATFNPNVTGGITSLALDAAGNVYVGGGFSAVGGQSRAGLAKVTPAGAVDLAWNPNPQQGSAAGSVWMMGYDPFTNALFVSGSFDRISGQPRTNLAKLSTSGGGAVDPVWSLQADSFAANAFTFDGAGNLYIGGWGNFSQGGISRGYLAKVATTGVGAVDPVWNPAPAGVVRKIVLDSANNVYIGGDFFLVGNATRALVARVSAGGAGAVDSFNVTFGNVPPPYSTPALNTLVLDGTSLYVGGGFSTVNGQTRANVAKISTITGALDAWNPSPDTFGFIRSMAVSSTQVYAAGVFTAIGGAVRYGFAALNKTNGAANTAFPTTYAPGAIYAMTRDSNGVTTVGGSFTHAGAADSPAPRSGLARFTSGGLLDSWNPNVSGTVYALVQNDVGNLFLGGNFTSVGGTPASNFARVSASTGALNLNLNANGTVQTLLQDQAGNLYAGGSFTTIGGVTRNALARVSQTTGVPDSWNPNPGTSFPTVYSLALDNSGRIYVGGNFSSIGGQAVSSLARVFTSTALADSTFKPPNDVNFNGIRALTLDGSGNIYVGGGFSTIGGQTRNNIARLSTVNAVVDTNWNPNVQSGAVYSMVLDGSGSLYVGGPFTSAGSQPRSGAAKVSVSTGAVDIDWNPAAPGYAILLDGTGNVCLGGAFATIAGQARASYACVAPTAPKVPPQFTSGSGTSFLVAKPGSFTVAATGTPIPTLSLVSGTLPSGITFNPATGILSGTSAIGTVNSYPLTFRASNGVGGPVDQSFILTIYPTPPAAPTLNAVAPGNTQASVAFTPPANDGGRVITKYTARCTAGSQTITTEGPTSPLLVSGLTNNTQYSCTVTGTNDQGEGDQSSSGSVTPCPSCTAPTPPASDVGSLAFGGQSMGTTSPAKEVTITNNGGATVGISSVSITAQFAQTNNCVSLSPGANCKVQVTFSPTVVTGALNSTSPVSGTLAIVSSLGNLTVSLSGTAEKSLVTHYYRSILRRAPDSGGFTFWSGEAARVAGVGANVNETWFALAGSFYASPEYIAQNRNTTEYVRDLYNTFYNRVADDGGLNFWTGQINSGLPREVVLIAFMFSTEFANFTQAIFGSSTVRAEVNTVIDFYRGLLGTLPDNGGFTYWRDRFRTAQCNANPSGTVTAEVEAISSAFAQSQQYANRARDDSQYVTDLYNAFLRRGGDLGGFNFWVAYVGNPPPLGAGELPGTGRERARRQFVASPEFQGRVAAIIGQGCMP